MIRFVQTDQHDVPEAISTFVVYDGDNAIGRVAAVAANDWRVTYAGVGVTSHSRYYPHLTRNGATHALLAVRETDRAVTVTVSGLTGLQEDVLLAAKEIGADAADNAISQRAAKLALSPVAFKQILFALLDDERADAFLPLTLPVLREQRAALKARRQARTAQREVVPAA